MIYCENFSSLPLMTILTTTALGLRAASSRLPVAGFTSKLSYSTSFAMASTNGTRETRVLAIDPERIKVHKVPTEEGDFTIELAYDFVGAECIEEAARAIRTTAVPVAFPTETVYGLGADATRSDAVRGIYAAKQRPSDNPLIVHVHSLEQVRSLLGSSPNGKDLIPIIYKPLIKRFWPGPLTILLSNPPNSSLAPEVTAGLPTFGARMPASPIALALIRAADRPLAAPSANASTKPSPTRAEHVLHDLNGRIDIILDGGSCSVGVESTVVDGLSCPPAILRPGGISLDELRECPGWEDVIVAYKDKSEMGEAPRAPGMKYKHYSPAAKVVLVKAGLIYGKEEYHKMLENVAVKGAKKIGVLRTRRWPKPEDTSSMGNGISQLHTTNRSHYSLESVGKVEIIDLHLGSSSIDVARNLFASLRELDLLGVGIILVEGVDESDGETAAAVMNRLRKAAEVEIDDLPFRT